MLLHAPDCDEAPQGAPLLDLDHALDLAENPATRLCTLCGCAQELTPILGGFDHGADYPSTLTCPGDQVGPCATCQRKTHKYGRGGCPLCQWCMAPARRSTSLPIPAAGLWRSCSPPDRPVMQPPSPDVMARLRVPRRRGRPRTRPDLVLADKAYSSHAIREHLRSAASGQ